MKPRSIGRVLSLLAAHSLPLLLAASCTARAGNRSSLEGTWLLVRSTYSILSPENASIRKTPSGERARYVIKIRANGTCVWP
jgi:hypothetical protein